MAVLRPQLDRNSLLDQS